jgi:2,4-dienoyl-CoA reductase-like NADH-dependent reductase (Old Yellow Enzyme family)
VASAVRAVWPRTKAHGMRITGCDWVPGGITPEEAGIFACELRQIGFDYVCVPSGGSARRRELTSHLAISTLWPDRSDAIFPKQERG